MKIPESSIAMGQQAYAKEVEGTKPPEINKDDGDKSGVKAVGDKVSLSKDAQNIQLAKSAVEAAPEIREEAVQDIKKSVDDGSYTVDSNRIADKMVGSNIDELV